jgi:polyisoprenoid-binding protein YceI
MNGIGAALTAVLGVLVVAGAASAETWSIDRDHSEVRFSWDHLGLSRQGGRFRDIKGTIEFDPAKPQSSRLDIDIPLAGISTGVAKLDEHLLKTKDFFDADTYPNVTFKSTGVEVKSDRTFNVSGDLTINGITHPATLDVIWNFTGDHPLANINPNYAGFFSSGFSATTQIRRSDWGIKRTIPYISDEIRIAIEIEMHRMTPPQTPPAVEEIDVEPMAGTASSAPAADRAPGAAGPPSTAPTPKDAGEGHIPGPAE